MSGIEIIAEIGVNHNGSVHAALELIDYAKNAGCDTVKFQSWRAAISYPQERWAEMQPLELSASEIIELKKFALHRGMNFLCTPDTIADAKFLDDINCERIKIGSSNVTNIPLLEFVRDLGLPVLLSTGACTFEECRRAVGVFENYVPITVMHCLSAYPAPEDELNLEWLATMKFWHQNVGFSDHTAYYSPAALVALGMGARTFEVHITRNRYERGPDHRCSLEPWQLQTYVATLRLASRCLGDGNKRIMPCEVENRKEYDAFVERQRALSSPG